MLFYNVAFYLAYSTSVVSLSSSYAQLSRKIRPAPLSGVTDPYSRSLYIGRFLPTNLQLMDERQKSIPPSRQVSFLLNL